MTDPIAPQPMTPEQIADLVERARLVTRRSLSERAAQHAHSTRVTCAEVGRLFGRGSEAVRESWHRLFPGEPVPLRGRPWP